MITVEDISKSVHAIILAGGSSDNPLARYRAMPAVELGTASATSQHHQILPVACAWRIDMLLRTHGVFCAARTGSSTQLIDISISNCIRSGVNKLCAHSGPLRVTFTFANLCFMSGHLQFNC